MLQAIRDWVWGTPLLLLIVGSGVYFTLRLNFVQFRYLPYALRLAFTRHDDRAEGDISHFQSLMTALAGTIGIGSIAGVATAMVAGGVGALFWMVICALVGMAIRYAEALMALKYRIRDKRGEMAGGPMYAIEKGLNWKWLAAIFSVAGAIAALTTGNMVQSNAMVDVVLTLVPIPRIWVGLLLAGLTAIVLFGGIRKIGRVNEFLVPIMTLLYLIGGVIIILMHLSEVPHLVGLIFRSALSGQAALGGFAGSTVMMAIQMGISRGVFASESGLGSAPIAAAAAKSDVPGRQAMISMTGGFLAVCIICVITGLVIGIGGGFGERSANGQLINGATLTILSFSNSIPGGGYIVVVGSLLFAYSTILSWSYYGERCVEYLFHERVIPWYRIFFILMVVLGAVLHLEVVWNLADLANALMAVPNLIGLLFLSKMVALEHRTFTRLLHQERGELL